MKSFSRLFDILDFQVANFPLATCLSYKYNTSEWQNHSSQEVSKISYQFALAFIQAGLEPGDHIAIISPNRPEWNFCDLGVMMAGGINVPIYPTSSENDYKFIFNEASIKFVFISDDEILQRIRPILKDCPSIKAIYSFDKTEDCLYYKDFLATSNEKDLSEVERRKVAIKPEDLATIIYTSGTTGFPKGVMLSHNNIVSNIHGVDASLPLTKGQKCLSFLPLCHIFERTVI